MIAIFKLQSSRTGCIAQRQISVGRLPLEGRCGGRSLDDSKCSPDQFGSHKPVLNDGIDRLIRREFMRLCFDAASVANSRHLFV
jgi:hypothetical protein